MLAHDPPMMQVCNFSPPPQRLAHDEVAATSTLFLDHLARIPQLVTTLHTPCAICSTLCAGLSDADWALWFDVVFKLGLQVTTFFHEFGHLMHNMIAGENQAWNQFSGLSMAWDFVEVRGRYPEIRKMK